MSEQKQTSFHYPLDHVDSDRQIESADQIYWLLIDAAMFMAIAHINTPRPLMPP